MYEIHGHHPRLQKSPTYQSWCGMMLHSEDVCQEWHEFIMFLLDMGERPKGHILGRLDVSKGFSLDNCRWVTPNFKSHNRRPFGCSGVRGVFPYNKKYWRAKIGFEYKQFYGPIRTTIEEATEDYASLSRQYYGEYDL